MILSFVKKIKKHFKSKQKSIFRWMYKLKENPNMGKLLTQVGGIKLKELKFNNVYRFYFFTNDNIIKILDEDELHSILIKFVEMSKKGKEQKEIINKLKKDLKKFGFDFF
jgi:hypothetical protein